MRHDTHQHSVEHCGESEGSGDSRYESGAWTPLKPVCRATRGGALSLASHIPGPTKTSAGNLFEARSPHPHGTNAPAVRLFLVEFDHRQRDQSRSKSTWQVEKCEQFQKRKYSGSSVWKRYTALLESFLWENAERRLGRHVYPSLWPKTKGTRRHAPIQVRSIKKSRKRHWKRKCGALSRT